MNTMTEIDRREWNTLRRQVATNNARFRLVLGACIAATVAAVVLWAPAAMSEPDAPVTTEYPDLYHFSPNTPALAAEVNSNFATLHARADSNTLDIASHSQSIASHDQSITDHTARIGDSEGDIASLQSGKLDKNAINRHGPYHASRNNSAGTSSTRMVNLTRSLCFLSKVSFEDVDSHQEVATCEVVAKTGYWRLEAYLHRNADADAWCSARCITW